MNIIFLGSSSYVIPILEVLKKNFDLSLVVTTEKNLSDAVPSFCLKNKIPYLTIKQFNNRIIKQLKEVNASIAILADFGLIVPGELLNAFPKGILNIHPSLLPKYRGPSPVQTAILNGDAKTGVSIIRLDEEIDHGPILVQKEEEIFPNDTAESLYKRLFKIGANLLPQTINQYIKGGIKLSEQNHSKATLTKPLRRNDGYIDISCIESKKDFERKIRAFYPWPGVWTKIRIRNHESRIMFLPDQKIQVEGKKPVSYKDLLNGYPNLQPELVELLKKLQ